MMMSIGLMITLMILSEYWSFLELAGMIPPPVAVTGSDAFAGTHSAT